MPEISPSFTFSGIGDLNAQVAVDASWSGLGTFVVAGLLVTTLPSGLFFIQKYVGEHNVPQDIKRLRRSVHDVMKRMGQPVIVKHMFNDRDVKDGIAEPSPIFDSVYGQVRNRDPYSHGIGFVSREKSTNEWIAPDGGIVRSDTQPAPTYVAAPKYRGFGPGYLTYLIEPDVATDFFKVTPPGAFIRIQQAQAQAPWFPDINDNDLIINVTLDKLGNVVDGAERYQAKMVNPVSIRGLDRRGRTEYSGDLGNRHVVNQTFEMSLVPSTNILYSVETDR